MYQCPNKYDGNVCKAHNVRVSVIVCHSWKPSIHRLHSQIKWNFLVNPPWMVFRTNEYVSGADRFFTHTHTHVMNRIRNGMCATAWYCVERHLFYWSHIHYVATPFILDYTHRSHFTPQLHTAVVAVVPLAVLCARGNSVRKLQQQQKHCVCRSTRMCGAVTNSYYFYLVLISVSVSPNLFACEKSHIVDAMK